MLFSEYISKWRRRILAPIFFSLDYAAKLICLFKHIDRSDERLLLIRVDAIGDFIIWLDSAKAYRVLYPDCSIFLVANNIWADLARDLPYWDEVLPLDRGRFGCDLLYRWRFVNKLLSLGCNIALQPTYSREIAFGDALVRSSGAKKCIGSMGDPCRSFWEKIISKRWYSRLVPADALTKMELERNAEFIRGIGLGKFKASLPSFSTKFELMQNQIPIPKPYFVIVPGAGWIGRMWPVSRFSQLAKQIHENYGWSGVICGGAEDEVLGQAIVAECGDFLVSLVGKTSLAEYTGIIEGSVLIISNETSAVHIAVAVGTPSVCIVGGGHFGRFLPYVRTGEGNAPLPLVVSQQMECFGCNWHCRYALKEGQPVPPCIEGISVDSVWKSVVKVLQ